MKCKHMSCKTSNLLWKSWKEVLASLSFSKWVGIFIGHYCDLYFWFRKMSSLINSWPAYWNSYCNQKMPGKYTNAECSVLDFCSSYSVHWWIGSRHSKVMNGEAGRQQDKITGVSCRLCCSENSFGPLSITLRVEVFDRCWTVVAWCIDYWR